MLFSIVIPVYNRQSLIGRALRSCLQQDFSDFEVIVVDDGSTDDSVGVVRGFADARIQLIVHEKNRGVGPARNSGFARARGEWVVCLDSDDELLPGALTAMATRACDFGDRADGMRFMVRFEDGTVSPDPPLQNEVWNYEAYVRWMEASYDGRQETLPVVRRSTFERVRYPEGRALEALYHLDFAAQFRIAACSDVVRLYHLDAPNQLTAASAHQTLQSAADQRDQLAELLQRHGDVLRRLAPRRFRQLLGGLSTAHFLSGNRVAGTRAAMQSIRLHPLSLQQWVVLAAGWLGPRPVAMLKNMRTRLS